MALPTKHLDSRTWKVLHRGIESAMLASVPQVLVPKAEEKLLLRGRENADLGPRLIQTLADRFQKRQRLGEDTKWLAASAFHFGYSAAWGSLYALAYDRHPVKPWVGGLLLGGLIHAITFPRWGLAVLVGTEKRPRDRSWRMEAVLATAPLVFGLGTALLYGRGPRRTLREKVERAWRKAT